jgi:hypothetical protein
MVTLNKKANGAATPSRVASGSARRNILAQQSMQHFKKQITNNDQYKKGTPKSRNANVGNV